MYMQYRAYSSTALHYVLALKSLSFVCALIEMIALSCTCFEF